VAVVCDSCLSLIWYGKGSIAVGVPLMVKVPPLNVPLNLRVILFTPAPVLHHLQKSDIVYGNVYTFGLIIGA
jgi:hypothetical protein